MDSETLYVCNICNEGVESEYDIRKHINKNHKDLILQVLDTEQDVEVLEKQVNEFKEPFKCTVCPLLGYTDIFTSSDDIEYKDHIMKHNEVSRKEIDELFLKKTERHVSSEEINDIQEISMTDSELYAGFDEDGNRIVEDDHDEK